MRIIQNCCNSSICIVLLLLLTACSSKKDKPKENDAAVSSKSAKAPLVVPDNVVAYGGVDSIQSYLAKATKLGQAVSPTTPPLESMVRPLMQTRFRLRSTESMDLAAPLRFAIFDQTTYGADPSALMFGIRNRASFDKAIPELGKKAKDQGNEWSFLKTPNSKMPVFVNFIGNNAVLTRSPKVFGQNKAFLEGLLAERFGDAATAVFEVAHATALYDARIKSNVREIKQTLTQKAPGGVDQKDAAVSFIDALERKFRQTERVSVALGLTTDAVNLDWSLHSNKDSEFSKMLSKIKAAPHDLLSRFPTDSPFFFSAAAEPGTLQALSAMGSPIGWTLSVLEYGALPAGPGADLVAAAKKALEAASPNAFAIAAHGSDGLPDLNISALMGAQNIEKVAQAQEKLVSAFGQTPIAEHYAKFSGSKLDLGLAKYQVSEKSVIRWGTETDNMDLLPPGLGDMSTIHSMFDKETQIITYGTNSQAVLKAHTAKTYSGLGQSPRVKAALGKAAEKPLFVGYISPLEIVKRVQLGGMNPLAPALADLPPGDGLTVTGFIEKGVFKANFHLPISMAQQGMKAFDRMKGAF